MAAKPQHLPATWLDAILAVPVVGLRPISPWEMVRLHRTTLELLIQRFQQPLSLSTFSMKPDGGFSLQSGKGLTIDFSGEGVIVSFKYAPIQQSAPGALETFKSPPRTPYSLILQEVLTACNSILECMGAGTPFSRIGIVAKCRLTEESAPPGYAKIIGRVEQVLPWELRRTEFSLATLLRKGELGLVQCHHAVKVDRTNPPREQELEILLDWQLLAHDGKEFKHSGVSKLLASSSREALAHFDIIGAGGFDGQ